MSRIGKNSIKIEKGIDIVISDAKIAVKGEKGELTLDIPKKIKAEQTKDEIIITRSKNDKKSRALHGLVRNLVQNMIEGVTKGYAQELELIGIGYRAKMAGENLELNLGFSHPVIIEPPENVTFELISETEIKISGIDKQKVGEITAKIRSLRKPEPYKGKGIRYKGEYVKIKQSKAATSTLGSN